MSDGHPIHLTEESLLLMLNDRSGCIEMVPDWDFACVMAGAVIAEREHSKRGAYAPCGLGHRWVELQMAVNLLPIACHATLEMVSADHKPRINPFLTAAPDRKMKFQVAELSAP